MAVPDKELILEIVSQIDKEKNSMTLQELRIFDIYLFKFNGKDKSTYDVKFYLSDFAEAIGAKRINVIPIKKSIDNLAKRKVSVTYKGVTKTFPLFEKCQLSLDSNDCWVINLKVHKAALPYIICYKVVCCNYDLTSVLSLKSKNQIRMYELFKRLEDSKDESTYRVVYDIRTLKEYLGIPETEYSVFSNFKIRVLNNCQIALEKYTDISYTYKCVKRVASGKWYLLEFIISPHERKDRRESAI